MGVDGRIVSELETLGYRAEIFDAETSGGQQRVVTFPYRIGVGRFKGETRNVGISTQCEAVGYPETPPHWIFISPPITDTRDGGHHGINNFAGREWVALSRPPGAFWDRVRHKGMRAYLEHLSRVWSRI